MLLPRELGMRLRKLWPFVRYRGEAGPALDAAEYRRSLRDAGLDPAAVASARVDSLADMGCMLRHAGLDPDGIPVRYRGALRDAERVCAMCRMASRCLRWQTATTNDAPRLFCPNMVLFDEVHAALRRQAAEPAPTPQARPRPARR